MNEIVEQKKSVNEVSISTTSTGSGLSPQTLGEVVRFAEVMARGQVAIPKHLRDNPGACMAVTMQAMTWQMDPFAVANKSYAVNDRLAYEAQLIAAVVNTRSGIKGRLKYKFEGEGPNLRCTVTGILDGEEFVYQSPPISSITTKNSPLWKSDPEQQLGYMSARSWARRHTPEVILGVYDRDEVASFQGPDNAKDVTPSGNAQKYLGKAPAQDHTSGFNAGHVDDEISSLNSDGIPASAQPSEQGDEVFPPASSPAPDVDLTVLRQVKADLFAILDMDDYQASDDPAAWAKKRAGVVMGRLQGSVLTSADQRTHAAAKRVLDAFQGVVDGRQAIEQADAWFDDEFGG